MLKVRTTLREHIQKRLDTVISLAEIYALKAEKEAKALARKPNFNTRVFKVNSVIVYKNLFKGKGAYDLSKVGQDYRVLRQYTLPTSDQFFSLSREERIELTKEWISISSISRIAEDDILSTRYLVNGEFHENVPGGTKVVIQAPYTIEFGFNMKYVKSIEPINFDESIYSSGFKIVDDKYQYNEDIKTIYI